MFSNIILIKNYLENTALSVLYPFIPSHMFMPKPTYIALFIGRNCPLHCAHCSFWKKKENYQLSYEQGITIIDKLLLWLGPFRLNISGGEPLLNTNILRIVSYAEKKGILCGMASNGFLINETIAKNIVQSGLSNINISLDSLDPKKHDRIRGTKGAFEKATQAIKLIQKFRHAKKPLIYINTVISGENMHDLIPMAQWVKDQNLDGINFQPIISDRFFGNTKSKKTWYTNNSLWPDKKIIHTLNDLLVLKTKGYPINNLEKNEVETIKNYFTNPQKQQKESCKIALRNFYIDHHGNATICQNYPSIGNIFKENPQCIWESTHATIVRKKIMNCHNDCQLLLCNRPHHIRRIIKSSMNFFLPKK